MKKLCSVFSLIIGFAMMFPGVSGSADKPILIGNLAPFTGAYSRLAKNQKDGVDMAVAEINKSGGLLGREVKVIDADTELKAGKGSIKMEQLILKNRVDFCVGEVASSVTLALMQIAKKYNKILMSPIAQSVKITGEMKNKQTFRVCANPSLTAMAQSKWMIENLGKKICLFSVDYAWGRSVSKTYVKTIEANGGTVVGDFFFPLGTKDFAPYFGKIKQTKPDVLFVTAADNDAISVVTQIKEYGLKKFMNISGDSSLVLQSVLRAVGKNADGIVFADWYAASLDTPENKVWAPKFKKLYGYEPSRPAVGSYVAVMWLAQAVKQAGTVDTDKVIAALEGSTFEGPAGAQIMDPNTHQTSLPIYLIKIENGKPIIFAKE